MCKITIVFDNYSTSSEFEASWGYAALIEFKGKRFLFDTGAKPEVLQKNLKALGESLEDIEALFLSHNHWDHTGGMPFVLSKVRNPVVYAGESYIYSLKKDYPEIKTCPVGKEPVKVIDGLYLTEEMEGPVKEISLFLESQKGIVVITGCAHPGAITIVKRIKEFTGKAPFLLLGGIHLYKASEEEIKRVDGKLKALGVEYLGVSHCTGDKALSYFESSWSERFLKVGVGSVINLKGGDS